MLKELVTSFVVSASAITPVADIQPAEHKHFVYGLHKKQAECLAQNMYHEAKNQGFAGQLAVALVVINRVKDHRFPNTICEVVHQGPVKESWKTKGKNVPDHERIYYPVRHKCQFSWWCDGIKDTVKKLDKDLYDDIYSMSMSLVTGEAKVVDITEGATHFHADYVRPAWRKTKTRTIEIEDHIFYRWENSIIM